ncbi:MAG: DUF748 domain-containing protein [Candidatus Brocadiaceae bacterium]
MLKIKSFFRVGRRFSSWSCPARIIIIGSFLVALYAALGFLIIPPIVKSRLVEKLSVYTGRTTELGELHMNPFALSMTLRKFELREREGKRFIGFDELYINFQVSSIFRRAYTFAELHLTAPYSDIKISKDGKFNFQDLLPSTSKKNNIQQGSVVPILIQHLAVDHGHISFKDYSRPTPFKAQIAALSFTLINFTTRPNQEGLYAFEATTGQGEALKYQGNISMAPLYSKGKLELTGIKLRTLWSYLQDQLNFEITGGKLAVSGDYEFDGTGEKTDLRVYNGRVNVQALSVVNEADGEKTLDLPSLTFSGTDIDYLKHQMKIARIQSDSSKIRCILEKDGSFNLQKMFKPKTTVEPTGTQTNEPPKSGEWKINIGQIEIADYAIRMKDQSTKPAAHLDLSPINLKLEDVQIGSPGTAHIELQAGMNQTGTITVSGKIVPDPVSAELDLKISKVALPPFQPYVMKYTKLEIKDGALSLNGHINFLQGNGHQPMDFNGDIWIDSVRAADPVLAEDFVRWGRLDLKQVKYGNNPPQLTINEIIARGLYTRIIIGPDHTANVQHILVEANKSPGKTSNQQTSGTQMPIRIGQVNMVDGSVNFADTSLTPTFATGIENLNGTIKGLSSEQLARADIDLKGQVDKYAPVFIQGQINPLSEQAYTDITTNFQGIELTHFSPYSGKYAGYKIEKGKLSLELHYKLSQKILIGENHVVVDQFTLGEKIESPDATKLPVRLAIAILKDSHGVIDINLPIRGDLNDPQFSLAPLIIKAFLNLVVKAATAPFKMLGALVGGEGEELEFISFAPGSNSLSQEQQSKLAKVAKALGERPQLVLNLRGTAIESVDRHGLAERTILARVRTQVNTPVEKPLAKEEQKRLLKLYKETFHKEDPYNLVPPTDKTGAKLPRDVRKASVVVAARKRLIEAFPVSDNELCALARERAVAVKDYMIQQGSIAEPRIFLLDVDTKASATDNEVKMQLALDAR